MSDDVYIKSIKDNPKYSDDKKSMIGIRLNKDVANKVKSFSYEQGITVSKVLESIISDLFSDVEINEHALKCYEEKYKKKSK